MRTWKLAWIAALAAGCAAHKAPPVPSDKDFELPTELADQFAVREGEIPAPPPPSPPAPLVEEPKAAKKAKAAKGKKGKMTAAEAPKKAQAPEPIPNRWTLPPLFHVGERYAFDITYFGATAGELVMETLPPKSISGRQAFHFRAVARSTSIFSLFYKVNDVAESFVDTDGLFSYKFVIKIDETRQTRDVLELYDNHKRKAYYWSKWNRDGKGVINEQSEIPLVPFAQDGLSAFYYVRTLPLAVGKSWEFPLLNNGKLRTVRVTVVRRENLSTRIGEIPAFVLKPEVVLDGVMQNQGDSFLWVSDDPMRRILKVDAKIKVGSVIAYLREYRNAEGVAQQP